MEETIWIFFGIIFVLLAMGLIAHVVLINKHTVKSDFMDNSLKKLEVQCNFICESTEGNILSIDVEIPSNCIVYTRVDKICSNHDGDIDCIKCNCDLEEYELNLVNTSISKKFSHHTYGCAFERLKDTVALNCQG